jgi:competence protein ComEC
MTKSKVLLYFCLCFISGISASAVIKISVPATLVFLVLGIILIAVFFHNKKIALLGFCIVFIALGLLRFEKSWVQIVENDFIKNDLYDKSASIEGIIIKEPDIREKSVKLTLGNLYLLSENGDKIPIRGRLLINEFKYPQYNYNDKIIIHGKVELPPEFDDFSYRNYLLKDGIFAISNFPKAEFIENNANKGFIFSIYSKILAIKVKSRENIEKNFNPPYSSILEGMILGDNGAMSQDLKGKLNASGLRHIIAISGSHIVIISSILIYALLALGFWRGQAFYISVALIFLFIIVAGLPASGIRAAIMGAVFLLAIKTGRKNASSRTIVLAAALMLLINPLLLFYDVGFQLSFLASMGIIFLAPILGGFLNFLKINKGLKEAMAMTFACQIFTIPILLYSFSSFSFASIITNILVLPAVYLMMIFGFISVLIGTISNLLAKIVVFPTFILLEYFLKIIDLFPKEWSFINIEKFSWLWIAVFYLALGFFIKYLNQKKRLKFLNY